MSSPVAFVISAEAEFIVEGDMNAERWRQVDIVFQQAVELEPDDRAAFLDNVCSDDAAFRAEVESLLVFDSKQHNFIDDEVLWLASPMLAYDPPRLMPGDKLAQYEIAGLIGRGGMGEVYLAKDERLKRRIALKLLTFDYPKDKDRLRRFEQEAHAASALNHPNILTIHELGLADGHQFIATEFVDGETLRQRMNRGPLSLREALDIAIQTASALAAAHQAGIVHRDIKPENIMLRPDGYVKVLDFGLAKLTEQHERTLEAGVADTLDTSSGLVMGTVKYMSPEQARGLPVDPRSDIFSLGVVLYEMVSGHAPFKGEAASALIKSILKDAPSPLTEYLPDAPKALQHIVNKALTKKREERYQTSTVFFVDLKDLKEELDLESKRLQSTDLSLGPERITLTNGGVAASTAGGRAVSTGGGRVVTAASSAEYIISEIKYHKIWAIVTLAILFPATVAFGYVAYKFLGQARPSATSQNVKLAKITDSGKAGDAAISPDGKYVAYVTSDAGERRLWMRRVHTNSNVQLDVPGLTAFWGLIFSPDGNYLYYFGSSNDDPKTTLYQMPAQGGVPIKLLTGDINVMGTPITLSPDGKRLAFVREYHADETSVEVANIDGTEDQKLATRRYPAFFGALDWSPDGSRIACAGGNQDGKGFFNDLVEIPVQGGPEKSITDRRWSSITDIKWLSDGSGLLMIASDREGGLDGIWELLYPTGNPRRMTTDLNHYSGLSLTADSNALVTTQTNQVFNIWTQLEADAKSAKQITSGATARDGRSGISWTPDNKIVYSSDASGTPDIWIMEPDGSNQKQLTMDLGSENLGLSVSSEGRYIVFVSYRGGNPNIWRADIDGSNAKQLTNGPGEFNPVLWPDGQWVSYLSNSAWWKIPIDGGEAVKLMVPPSNWLAISPDGELLACTARDDQTNGKQIQVYSSTGTGPIKFIKLSPTVVPRRIQWAPDGRALTYIAGSGPVSNIWSQPLDGSPAKQLTDFKTNFIRNFVWSNDGKYLAFAKGTATNDIVLMSDFR